MSGMSPERDAEVAAVRQERSERSEDPRTAPVVLLRFYDDDHGPCADYKVGAGVTTLPVPVDAEEVTVDLVLPEPDGPGVTAIRAERSRQVTGEGYTPEHDAGHPEGELARAGATYALWAAGAMRLGVNPYDAMKWWPPGWRFGYGDDPVRTLTKAGALIAAEIDRIAVREEKS
jgi:hypothetical protein